MWCWSSSISIILLITCVFARHVLQVEELRCLFPLAERAVPSYLPYMGRKNALVENGVKSPNLASNCAIEKGDSDTTLQLGYYAFLLPNLQINCKRILLPYHFAACKLHSFVDFHGKIHIFIMIWVKDGLKPYLSTLFEYCCGLWCCNRPTFTWNYSSFLAQVFLFLKPLPNICSCD